MIAMMMISLGSVLMLLSLTKAIRHLRAVRDLNTKRETLFFQEEPFLWMRRVK